MAIEVFQGGSIPRELSRGAEALAIFQGPHAYVSPRWYASEPNVPTWNYIAVHATGVLSAVTDASAVRALLARSAGVYEADAARPWSLASIPDAFANGLQKGIVAFELALRVMAIALVTLLILGILPAIAEAAA